MLGHDQKQQFVFPRRNNLCFTNLANSVKNPRLAGKMAQLDFRQAFSSPSGEAPLVLESEVLPSDAEEITAVETKRTLATHLPQLHQSYRTTFLFAVFIFVGGLFCAFYFFNGAEVLRAAAAWSREFLYPRPSALVADAGKADALKPESAANPSLPSLLRDPRKPGPDRDANASPFGRNTGSPNSPSSSDSPAGAPDAPAGTSLPGSSSVPDPNSLLGQLNLLPAGEDALSEVMNRAADHMARVANLYANSPVKVIQAPVSQVTKKAAAQARAARRDAQNAIAIAATQQNLKNNARQTSQATSSARSELSPLSRIEPPTQIIGGSAVNRTVGMGGSLGGSMGGLGGVGGLGGNSGVGGGTAGGIGGLGGVGGTVGGLLGGGH